MYEVAVDFMISNSKYNGNYIYSAESYEKLNEIMILLKLKFLYLLSDGIVFIGTCHHSLSGNNYRWIKNIENECIHCKNKEIIHDYNDLKIEYKDAYIFFIDIHMNYQSGFEEKIRLCDFDYMMKQYEIQEDILYDEQFKKPSFNLKIINKK